MNKQELQEYLNIRGWTYNGEGRLYKGSELGEQITIEKIKKELTVLYRANPHAKGLRFRSVDQFIKWFEG